MTDIGEDLRARIAADGPLPVDEYMAACVKAYYADEQVFGREGDFITAPEISQVFGELIGLWMAVVWRAMGQPNPVRLVELGPGRGTLMADLLRAAKSVPPFAAALDIHMVEQSPTLRDRQREALGDVSASWHDTLDDVPEGPMLLIGNEFLDALPVRQIERTPDGWHDRAVDWSEADGRFVFVAGGPVYPDTLAPAHRTAEQGSIVETSPAVQSVCAGIASRLVRDGGAALLIDYGHAATAPGDTLQAVKGHAYADVLSEPGAVDLTAHVDFEAAAAAARAAGAEVAGAVGQGAWLRALGLETRVQALLRVADPRQGGQIAAGARRLIHPDEMGTLFKVLALAGPGLGTLPGFEGVS